MSVHNSENQNKKTRNRSDPGKLAFILAACVLVLISAVLVRSLTRSAPVPTIESSSVKNFSEAAAKMKDTPLGQEDEAVGADWYQISDNNKLLTAAFAQQAGGSWFCTISDEDALVLEEGINDPDVWSVGIRPAGDKNTESSVYFDRRKEGSSDPDCIYILKIRTDGNTLRVIGIEEQPEK